MTGRPSDAGWDDPQDLGAWHRAGSSLLSVAVGLSWVAVCVAGCLSSPLYLAIRMHDGGPIQAGDDL